MSARIGLQWAGPAGGVVAGLLVGEVRRRLVAAQLHAARHSAATDALTGLANRAGMGTAVAEAVDRSGVAGLLLVDLDGFKAVNDTYGHTAGDTVLRCVADRLRVALLPGERAARHGGDEFSVLLTATAQPWAARRATVVAQAVAGPVALPCGAVVVVRASVGHAVANTAPALWEAADESMYAAKRTRLAGVWLGGAS